MIEAVKFLPRLIKFGVIGLVSDLAIFISILSFFTKLICYKIVNIYFF